MRKAAGALLFCALLLTAGLAPSCSDQSGPLRTGESPGDFRLPTFDHGRFYLNRQKGRVTLLVFWATTCLGCREEVEALKKVRADWGEKDLCIAAVCIDPENTDLLAAIVKDLAPPFPVLLDRDRKVFTDLGLSEVPSTVILDRDNRAAMVKVGYDPALGKQVKDKLAQLLAHEGRN